MSSPAAAFSTGSPAYKALKLNEWRTRSTDRGQGASGQKTLTLNVPISVSELAAEIVASRKFPLRTYSDLWRDALVIGLSVRSAQLQDPHFTRLSDEISASFERTDEKLRREIRRNTVRECQELMQGTAYERAKGVELTKAAIASMDDPTYRAQLQALLP